MLLEIKVSHFAIIDSLHLIFKPGLNILSGETGAGKSVLLKSLGLLMGAKAATDLVPPYADHAVIEGCFDVSTRTDIQERLTEMGIEFLDNVLVIRRLISAQGQSRVYLNGALSTLMNLREIVSPMIEVAGPNIPLIEMTGQHESRHLLSRSYHLEILDRYCGNSQLRQKYQDAYQLYKDTQEEITNLENKAQDRAQRLDYLIYQRDEIESFNPQPGEDIELEENVRKLKSLKRLVEFSQVCEDIVSADEDSVLRRIEKLQSKSIELRKYDQQLSEMGSPLTDLHAQLEDWLYNVHKYVSELESDPEKLEQYESRLSELRHLQKKFGPNIEDILERFESLNTEIHSLENSDSTLKTLYKQQKDLLEDLKKMAADLSKRRKEGARLLIDSVNAELSELNMKGVLFSVTLDKSTEVGPTGFDQIEFTTRGHNKDEPKPLSKAASGGELSRILLSLKQVVGHSQLPRTYLFDEVDTGVSGETAQKVGLKLRNIAQGQQVICVTHLPQVAIYGDAHYLIEKDTAHQRPKMSVQELKKETRVKEIARLISGEKISRTSLDHARELLEQVH